MDTGKPRKNQNLSPALATAQSAQRLQKDERRIIWSIAGFDPSSGAGVTADLMTFAAHGLFGCSAITALTVQNTVGVSGWEPVHPELLKATLQALQDDLPPAGIKVGMLGQAATVQVVSAHLRATAADPAKPVIVLDPVLRSSSGRVLLPEDAVALLREELLPQVDWITPNWAELEVLATRPVTTIEDARKAAEALAARHPRLHVIATGGDQLQPMDLLVMPDGTTREFHGNRIETTSTHGTGCAFSSALVSLLVLGKEPHEAVRSAKAYVEGALQHAPGVGGGRGPMGLLWPLQGHSQSE